jgi:hypothetical protein
MQKKDPAKGSINYSLLIINYKFLCTQIPHSSFLTSFLIPLQYFRRIRTRRPPRLITDRKKCYSRRSQSGQYKQAEVNVDMVGKTSEPLFEQQVG